MNLALQKTIVFLLIIGVGLLLRKKTTQKEHLGGIKMLILSVALPAMIFVALLKIEIELHLLYLPLLALGFNLIMLVSSKYVLPFFGIEKNSARGKTFMMLIPSLAPGLSCFPYLLEYLGEEMFAWAALADIGNKVFVLIILYVVAMHWYYARQKHKQTNGNDKLKDLFLALIKEPINLVIITAIVLLSIGVSFSSLPLFAQDTIGRLSTMMTPLILLFIGLAVRVKRKQISSILGFLVWRSGMAFCLSALLILVLPASTPVVILILAVAFPQSSASFWPFAHISAVDALEKDTPQKTFELELGLAVLAFSLPFSTILILAICSSGAFFTAPSHLFTIGFISMGIAFIPYLLKRLKTASSTKKKIVFEMKVVEEA